MGSLQKTRDLISPYTPSRSLRSANSLLLHQPLCKLKTMGERAFSCKAPTSFHNQKYANVGTIQRVD